MNAPRSFRFDRNYDNKDQVAEFLPEFLAVHAEITDAGEYPYNDSFKGRIPGIEGPDEDTAIYLLQTLKSLRELDALVAERLAEGYEHITALDGITKFRVVVHYGFYMGGTGWQQWPDARLVPPGAARYPRSWSVLPKGRRTNGVLLSHKIMALR
jgi:hypothetical protein